MLKIPCEFGDLCMVRPASEKEVRKFKLSLYENGELGDLIPLEGVCGVKRDLAKTLQTKVEVVLGNPFVDNDKLFQGMRKNHWHVCIGGDGAPETSSLSISCCSTSMSL